MNRKRIFVLLFAVILLAVACCAAGYKAYSLYTGLCSKMDYTNETIYELSEKADSMQRQLNQRAYHFVSDDLPHYRFDDRWARQTPPLIAHALGGIDGNDYTNSLEAFEQNYALGYRVFEVDLSFPDTDYTLIASHDRERWLDKAGLDDESVYSYKNFMNSTLYGQYTPLDFRDIIDLMAAYPDIYIVTDTKYTDAPSVMLQFSQLVKYAQSVDESVLSRLIPQIYHEAMLGWVMSVYPFPSVIYTLYQSGSTVENALEFCQRSGIGFLTMPVEDFTRNAAVLSEHPEITVAVHTVNDVQEARYCLDAGADWLYTDFLPPEEFGLKTP